jgi:hypothetical protein
MKHPLTADRPRTIRPRAGRRKKARRPSLYVVRVAEESSDLRYCERRFTVDELLPSACVDLPATRRYSPDSFETVAEHGHD